MTIDAQIVLQSYQQIISTPTEEKDVRINPARVNSTVTDVVATNEQLQGRV
jgi:hypothetical protein